MKKVFKSFAISLCSVAMFMFVSVTAKADDCSANVDKICDGYNAATQQMEQSQDMQALMSVDMSNLIMKPLQDVDKDCYSYELTQEDKDRLAEAFEKIFTTLVNKADEFSGGMAKGMLTNQLNPMMEQYRTQLNNAKTLGDYVQMN